MSAFGIKRKTGLEMIMTGFIVFIKSIISIIMNCCKYYYNIIFAYKTTHQ
jgi:hypothetical protein